MGRWSGWERAAFGRAGPLKMSSTATPRAAVAEVRDPGPEELDAEILTARRPVLIHGAMDGWPALDRWSAEYLSERAGDREVRVTHSPEGIYDAPSYMSMRFHRFLDSLAAREGERDQYYITGVPIAEHLPELAADVGIPRCVGDGRVAGGDLFLGRDTVTVCHYHSRHQNVLAQLVGTKKVVLFAPSDTRYLYPKSLRDPHFNHSRIRDPEQYDRRSFPRFERATAIRVELSPGMMLHIPVHWWHFVYGEGLSASLAFFWPARWRHWSFPRPGFRSALKALVADGRALVRGH